MKNKSYKKILALTLAAALVGGNAVATFATESTTDTGVTASEDRILGDSKEKPIKVTFKMSGDIGTAYFKATNTTESSDEVEVGKYSNLPKISLPVDCELTGWEVSSDDEVKQPVKTLAANQTTYTYDTVKGLKNPVITAVIKKKAETAQKTVVATFNAPEGATLVKASENGGEYVDDTHTAIKFTATSNDQKFNLPTVITPEGYEFTGWTGDTNAGEVTLDAGATEIQGLMDYGFFNDETNGYVTFTGTSKEKETVKEARDVIVNFNVDPEKGEFTDPADAKVVTFTIKEDDEEQYNVPTVKAKEGYVFTGWEVQGEETGHWDADAKTFGVAGLAHFPEGSDEGYVTVTAQFEKAKPEEKEARDVKVTFNVDPEKGEFTDPAGAEYVNFTIKEDDGEQYLVPTVAAKEGYVFTGWEVQGEETGHWDADAKTFGIAGLAHFPEGSNEGYVTVTAQFEKAEPEEKEARDVIVNFNVDPEKGDFTDPAGAKVVTFTIKEDDGNQYLVPTVEAKEGYVFTGWEVQGEETGHWDADAKTFGVTGLAHFPEGSNEGYVTVNSSV